MAYLITPPQRCHTDGCKEPPVSKLYDRHSVQVGWFCEPCAWRELKALAHKEAVEMGIKPLKMEATRA